MVSNVKFLYKGPWPRTRKKKWHC